METGYTECQALARGLFVFDTRTTPMTFSLAVELETIKLGCISVSIKVG